MRDPLNKTITTIQPSGIRKFFDVVHEMKDAISLGVGEPDFDTPWHIRDEGIYSLEKGKTHYTSNAGLKELKVEIDHYLDRHYGVSYDPDHEIMVTIGGSEAIDAAMRAMLDPGDEVLIPQPSYVSYVPCAVLAGAKPVIIPLKAENEFRLTAQELLDAITEKTKILILPYPNNPTGAQAPRGFLERAIELAHEHRFAIVQDFAYAGLGVREQQISILSLPGAFDVAVEVCSLSKMYAMAGWRAGFIAGNSDIVSHVKQYHYQMGSMITGSVQDAGAAALESDQSCVHELAERYALRRKIVAGGLRELGLDVFDSDGGIYAWVHAPEGLNGEQFADLLLERAAVAALPGTCFGKVGIDYVRFSLLKSEDLLREAVRRVAGVL